MDERILSLLDGRETYYPHALEQQFPRVLKKIVEWWDTPDVANYLYELMVDSRGGTRQGFPSEVASDISTCKKFITSSMCIRMRLPMCGARFPNTKDWSW